MIKKYKESELDLLDFDAQKEKSKKNKTTLVLYN